MSAFTCGQCGAAHHIFGESRIDHHAGVHGLEVLGRLPLDSVTAIAADQGQPIVVAAPQSDAAKAYIALAGRVTELVAGGDADAPDQKFAGFFTPPTKG